MLVKLDKLEIRYDEIGKMLTDPLIIQNQHEFQKLAKEHANMTETIELYREYKKLNQQIRDNTDLLNDGDEELKKLAKAEIDILKSQCSRLEGRLKILLLPKDPNDEKNIILEIRAGAGGNEAGLFASDLFRMYSKYAEKNNWKIDIMNQNSTGVGGYKEIIALIEGKGAYSKMKFESGVHRVQRVPVTEAQGRIHTSTVTVAILPEAEEVEIEIRPEELRIDVFRSSGPGGQSVNTTDSAVRITHLPTGMVVTCQDEKSQHKNKVRALKILRARLLNSLKQKQHDEISAQRKNQVGTGERSEKIRTYNFPQNRVTDHRISLTLYKLEYILDGNIDELIDALILNSQTEEFALTA